VDPRDPLGIPERVTPGCGRWRRDPREREPDENHSIQRGPHTAVVRARSGARSNTRDEVGVHAEGGDRSTVVHHDWREAHVRARRRLPRGVRRGRGGHDDRPQPRGRGGQHVCRERRRRPQLLRPPRRGQPFRDFPDIEGKCPYPPKRRGNGLLLLPPASQERLRAVHDGRCERSRVVHEGLRRGDATGEARIQEARCEHGDPPGGPPGHRGVHRVQGRHPGDHELQHLRGCDRPLHGRRAERERSTTSSAPARARA